MIHQRFLKSYKGLFLDLDEGKFQLSPTKVTIEPHLEMSYNLAMPAKIIFFCHEVFLHRIVNSDGSKPRPPVLRREVKPLCVTCARCLSH